MTTQFQEKTYTVRVRRLGINYACIGQLLRGRTVVAETRTYPASCTALAYAAAMSLASDIVPSWQLTHNESEDA